MENEQLRWLLDQNDEHQNERRGWQEEWRVSNNRSNRSQWLFYITLSIRPIIEFCILVVLVLIWRK